MLMHKSSSVTFILSSHRWAVNCLLYVRTRSLACRCLLSSESSVPISQWHHEWQVQEWYIYTVRKPVTDIEHWKKLEVNLTQNGLPQFQDLYRLPLLPPCVLKVPIWHE